MEVYNDFEIVQGQKSTFAIWITDEQGVILPLTSMKARTTIIYGDYDGSLALELTTENGGIVITDDKLHHTVKTAQAAQLQAIPAVYETELIDSENEVFGVLRGNITILKGKVQ